MRRRRRPFLCHEGGHGEAGHAGGHSHTHQNTRQVLNRLSRITGHLNAVKTMVETGRDCSEVLIQLAAVQSALNGVCQVILEDHIDHCIVDAVQTGDMAAIEELNKAIKTLMKK
ncbi:MAG: metal-sensing transcriptional repressor [Oscillospiraceae bacterium]|nr:metal-sensing transcriptional repressor [Oscillospiraceae bacterium]